MSDSELRSRLIALFKQGVDAYDKQDYDTAIDVYSQIIALEPEDSDTYYNRGLAYLDKDEHDHAIADFTRSIAFFDDDASCYFQSGARLQCYQSA